MREVIDVVVLCGRFCCGVVREVINVVVLCGRLLMLWCCAGGY